MIIKNVEKCLEKTVKYVYKITEVENFTKGEKPFW